jgi:predicted dehydrogenase
MEFGVAIIGCGDMGGVHASAWADRPDSKVLAVFDPLERRRLELAQKTGAAACGSAEEAIACDGVNVVSVCTPVCLHADMALLAAAHGRHVLCEKPIALRLHEADSMIAAAEQNGVLLAVSYQYRGIPRYRKCRELFQAGEFGGPLFARFVDVREVRPKVAMHRRSMNGGPVIDMAGHYFDLMRFITGEEPEAVSARGHVFGAGKQRLEGLDDLAVDAAEIVVHMSGGHVLSVFVNWGMPEGFPGLGYELIAGPAMAVQPEGDGLAAIYSERRVVHDLPAVSWGPGVRIDDLVSAVRTGGPLKVSGADGRRALEVSLAALQSIDTARTVPL